MVSPAVAPTVAPFRGRFQFDIARDAIERHAVRCHVGLDRHVDVQRFDKTFAHLCKLVGSLHGALPHDDRCPGVSLCVTTGLELVTTVADCMGQASSRNPCVRWTALVSVGKTSLLR